MEVIKYYFDWALDKLQEKYDDLVEKTKDFLHAIKLAPQRVTEF